MQSLPFARSVVSWVVRWLLTAVASKKAHRKLKLEGNECVSLGKIRGYLATLGREQFSPASTESPACCSRAHDCALLAPLQFSLTT